MLHGDIFDIRKRLLDEYPQHDIVYVGSGRYNVIEKHRKLRYEGDYNGRPLFSMTEGSDVVFSFNHTPDMRVIWKLREIDVWKHPRGMNGFFDDIEEADRIAQQKRDERLQDEFAYAARENHRRIFNEMDGMSKSMF